MFREMRRKKKDIGTENAMALLENERRGVLAVNGDLGYPYAVPVNYFFDREKMQIIFHGSRIGHKIESIKKDDRVCFTVFGNEKTDPEETWAPYLQSVVVFGRCRITESLDETPDLVHTLAEKYYPDENSIREEIDQDIKGVAMFIIDIEHMTGKQIQEK